MGAGEGSAVEVELEEEEEEATTEVENTTATTLPEETTTTEEPNTTNINTTTEGSGDSDEAIDGAQDQDNDETRDVDDSEGAGEEEASGDDEEDGDDDEHEDDDDEDEKKPKLPPIPFPPRPRAFDKVVDSISDFADKVKSGISRHGKMTDDDIHIEEDAPEDYPSESEDASNSAPVFVMHPSMIQFFAPGEPFALVCSAESPDPASEVTYSWTRNGRPMNMEDAAARLIFRENEASNGNLIFVSPGTGDVGTYTCLAENDHGKTYSRGSVVMIRKKAAESDSDSEETVEEMPKMEVETGDDDEVVPAETERKPRKEGVFLVFPTVAVEAEAQIVEDAGTDPSEE